MANEEALTSRALNQTLGGVREDAAWVLSAANRKTKLGNQNVFQSRSAIGKTKITHI